jgi:hypothetical protein
MKTTAIAWIGAALLAVGLSGTALAGGHGYKHGYYDGPAAGYGAYGYRGREHGYKGHRYGYRSGYRNAYRRYGHAYRPGHRAWRHGYRKGYHKGYRHGYRKGHRRSYYPDEYRYDPLLGHVRGIYYPGGHISLHFGF